jgi:CheY-like chemotaxis protein
MDALEALKEERYDLLFMDIRMPGIDGIKTTRFIRDEMKIPESYMPIVCISAAPVNEEMQKYIKAGMSAFLQKPFTEEKLLSTIMEVLKINPQIGAEYTNDTRINKPASELICKISII